MFLYIHYLLTYSYFENEYNSSFVMTCGDEVMKNILCSVYVGFSHRHSALTLHTEE